MSIEKPSPSVAAQTWLDSPPDAVERVKFQQAVVDWFEQEGLDYPWRRTTDPYAILVSEMMLQQTQIATVLGRGYFSGWMERFPHWEALAAADEAAVMKAWEGLGYYQRARRLHEIARQVQELPGRRFPDTLDGIIALPGVGRYTAGAVLSFAYNQSAPIVDGNIARVLSRLTNSSAPIDLPATMKLIWGLAEVLTPEVNARAYNSGVMEIGQRFCLKTRPLCGECPVAEWCGAQRAGTTDKIPVKAKRTGITLMEEKVAIVIEQGGIYLEPETGSRRRGLLRLPLLDADTAAALPELFAFNYAVTRYRVTLRVYDLSHSPLASALIKPTGSFYSVAQLDQLPATGAPYQKAIARYFDQHHDG